MTTIREAIKESGMTVQDIAQQLSCHRMTVYRIMDGTIAKPDIALARRLHQLVFQGRQQTRTPTQTELLQAFAELYDPAYVKAINENRWQNFDQ